MPLDIKESLKYSPLSRILTLPKRASDSVPYLSRKAWRVLTWTLSAREYINYSYDYEEHGVHALAAAIGSLTGVPPEEVRAYANEIRGDETFRARHADRMSRHPVRHICQPDLHFGKSMLYYALTRACRPKVIFEAGTERGLGAYAVCRALARNATEGHVGHLYTIDIDTQRGEFLDGDEGGLVTRLTGDSVETLRAFDKPIDCFIHDTISAPDHCRAQYAAVGPKLSPGAMIFSVYFEPEFRAFCERNRFPHFEYIESPRDHWFRGRNCGFARALPYPPI